ncbi:MAG: 4-hydroxy-tetrahydrodipicolinate reductase [Planctomycetota bacterium]
MIRLAVHGASGRIGSRICALALPDPRFRPVAVPGAGGRDGDWPATEPVDVIVDFTSDEGARRAAAAAVRCGAALLVGTTGLSPETLDAIGESARSVPVMVAPNTSLGVAVMRRLVAEAARCLGTRFDVDIVDRHRAGKRDAPSGTALDLADHVGRARGAPVVAERLHAIRAGDIAGEHAVEFSGPAERLEIRHTVADRDVFARGALHAAAWLVGRPPGRYAMEDALEGPPGGTGDHSAGR